MRSGLRKTLFALSIATLSWPAPADAQDAPTMGGNAMTRPIEVGFAPVGALRLYYEIHGSGEPLILLHGGVAASESFGANLTELARDRRVIAVHLEGHGRTRALDRPLRFESMADDIAGLVAHLGLEKVDILGYSLGGGVALQTAIRHPGIVDRLILVSAAMRRDGWYPEVLATFDGMVASAPQIAANVKEHSPLARLYPDVDWETLFTSIGDLHTQVYDWSAGVAALESPTMIIFADADAVRPDHIVEFYRRLGGGQRDAGLDGSGRPASRLAIVPGATHYDILSTPAVARMAIAFLNAPRP